MKYLLSIIFFIAAFAFTATAQQACPENLVCLSREAAQAALQAGDRAKALQTENDALTKAIADLKDALNAMKVQYAEASGELTILKQQQVADRALMTVLVQNTKKKRFGLINIF